MLLICRLAGSRGLLLVVLRVVLLAVVRQDLSDDANYAAVEARLDVDAFRRRPVGVAVRPVAATRPAAALDAAPASPPDDADGVALPHPLQNRF